VKMSTGGSNTLQGGTACKDAIVFFIFLHPLDERKNPDWSDLNELLNSSL